MSRKEREKEAIGKREEGKGDDEEGKLRKARDRMIRK